MQERYQGRLEMSLIKRSFLNSPSMRRSMNPISKPKSGYERKTQSQIDSKPARHTKRYSHQPIRVE